MLDVPFRSARQLAAAVRKKKIGCLELLDLQLARVEKYDPALNAIVVRDINGARRRARAAVYEPATWGPPETDRLAADLGGWHDPKAAE